MVSNGPDTITENELRDLWGQICPLLVRYYEELAAFYRSTGDRETADELDDEARQLRNEVPSISSFARLLIDIYVMGTEEQPQHTNHTGQVT